ncbi:Putative pterin-4-alpha-carbinolamine dehydratase [Mycobacterium basiliense]|uniref:Putative pterin-4-alpha-carbinolamine dehydratase n=1 Tax=Mycobacterium basiliense TaxID=2094119 RepID=A0A3S4FU19_9MYCO|nr:4a-hydroxytetrahydrobiopterin dehydratase [Mycobacterium basiliense]VDM90735.1 Putative pterin-4-alpha-carbinolamine dehydratase [Mycobacterium basiliense]
MALVDSGHGHVKPHAVCDGAAVALNAADIAVRLNSMPGWQLVDGHLHRTFHCASFAESVGFVTQLAMLAERHNHHPDFAVTNKREVSVVIWTRQSRCLTPVDFDLAHAITAAYPVARKEAGH